MEKRVSIQDKNIEKAIKSLIRAIDIQLEWKRVQRKEGGAHFRKEIEKEGNRLKPK